MKNELIRSFIPNKKLEYKSTLTILVLWVVSTLGFWMFSDHKLIPNPFEILAAGKDLIVNKSLVNDLITSTWLCMSAMFFSVFISLFLATLSVLPFFRPFSTFATKSRFLTAVGLSFLFAQLTSDTSGQKMALMIFGISVFLVTSFSTIIAEIKKEEFDYARTLKMNEWETVWYVIILGKADQFMEAIRQNFAIAWMMLPMVENLCRAEGGIGIVLFDQNKHFHLDAVYAVQIIILFMGIFLDWSLGFLKRVFFPYSVLTLERK